MKVTGFIDDAQAATVLDLLDRDKWYRRWRWTFGALVMLLFLNALYLSLR